MRMVLRSTRASILGRVTSRAALVTGAARGIGKAVAHRLIADGYDVVIADVDAVAGEKTSAELGCPFVEADVSREDHVAVAVEGAIRRYGGLNVLICNAGVGASAPVAELSLDDWNRVIGTNLTGTFLCARHAAPHLRANGGVIVNIASTRAIQSEPNSEAYAASKGGIVALTHALA